MPDDNLERDIEIIHTAYAERVKEAFKVFAENLGMGEGEKGCRDRFLRSLELTRKARDIALQAMHSIGIVEPTRATAEDHPSPADDISAADREMIEHVMAGTTGVAARRR